MNLKKYYYFYSNCKIKKGKRIAGQNKQNKQYVKKNSKK